MNRKIFDMGRSFGSFFDEFSRDAGQAPRGFFSADDLKIDETLPPGTIELRDKATGRLVARFVNVGTASPR